MASSAAGGLPSSSLSLVTGSSRGIGLEICRTLHSKGCKVIALCRKSNPELDALLPSAQIVTGVDVATGEGLNEVVKKITDFGGDVGMVINNAGILYTDTFSNIDFERAMLDSYKTNAVGPLRIATACLPFMKEGSKIVMITSRVGSLGDNFSGSNYSYRMSKAALNMAAVSLSVDLKGRGIAVGIVHPGYVKTDMTAKYNSVNGIEPTQSAAGIVARCEELSMSNSGTFWHAVTGEILPW